MVQLVFLSRLDVMANPALPPYVKAAAAAGAIAVLGAARVHSSASRGHSERICLCDANTIVAGAIAAHFGLDFVPQSKPEPARVLPSTKPKAMTRTRGSASRTVRCNVVFCDGSPCRVLVHIGRHMA